MAKKISDEVIKLNIVINGNEAQKEILDLEKANIKLKDAVKELNKQEKVLGTELDKTRKSYESQKQQLDKTKTAFDQLNRVHAEAEDKLKKIEAASGKNSAQYRAQAKVVNDLEREGKRLWDTQDRLATSYIKLGGKVKDLEGKYIPLKKEIDQTNASIDKNDARLKELTGTLKLTEMTTIQLKARARELSATLAHLIPETDDYKKYKAELDGVNGRLSELNSKGKAASWSIGSLADNFNRYAALAASAVAALTGVVLSIQKMIDFNGKLAEKMTDVQKTTGMTKREVDELAKSFGALKTRTGRIELLGIAEVGGRLGIAKDEIGDFVRVMNKAGVALGDSFQGGPDVVADKLGKIKGLYEELKNSGVESAFESVGSALNDLGAAGTASEANVAEFAQRVGDLPGALKPSIQQALGLGAAFEESGLKAEIAATNYGKVISIAARDTGAFAKVMGRNKKELEDLINTDPTEFFLQFSNSLKGLDATDLAKILDYLKLNDNEVKMVLGAAADNTQLFRDKIELAKQSMADATSLTTEYDLKNSNLAATLARLKKVVEGWFTSDSVVAFLESAVNWLAKFVGAIEDSEGSVTGWRNGIVFMAKVLSILVTGIFSYVTATKLAALWSNNLKTAVSLSNIIFRLEYAQLVINQVATRSLALAKAFLTFNITKVRDAYRSLTLAMGMNPFGALLAVVAAVTTAFIAFRKSNDDTEKSIKKVNAALETDIQYKKELGKATTDLKSKIDPLIAVLKDEDTSLQTRKKAYEKLIEISPDFVGTVDAEFRATEKLAGVYDKLLKNLEAVSLAKARAALRDKISSQVAEAENAEYDALLKKIQEDKINVAIEKRNKERSKTAYTGGGASTMGGGTGTYATNEALKNDANEAYVQAKKDAEVARQNMENYTAYIAETVKKLEQKLKKVKADSEEAKKIQAEIDSLLGLSSASEETTGKKSTVPGDAGKSKSRGKTEAEKRLEATQKALKEAAQMEKDFTNLERQVFDERIALLEDNIEKEEALEAEKYRRRIEDLTKQKVREDEIAKMQAKIDDPNTTSIQRGAYTHILETWLEKNKHIDSLIEIEKGRHEIALEKISEKGETKRLQDLQRAFDREGILRETAHNEELAAYATKESAKKYITDKFNRAYFAEGATEEQKKAAMATYKAEIASAYNVNLAKERLQKKYNEEELQRQLDHLNKMLAEKDRILADDNNKVSLDLLTEDQKKSLQDDVDQLKLKISELLKAKADLTGNGDANNFASAFANADILGFTADQWTQVFNNLDTVKGKLEGAQMVVSSLQNIWGQYNAYVAANENASLRKYEKNLDTRKKKLKWQLDNGYINQQQYTKGLELLDAELDKKKADLEYKQAKRQKQMAIVDAILNTAKGVTAALGMAPPASYVFAALTAAMGAVQIATISKQPLPARGYEEGLYPEYVRREQDGKMFKAGYGGKTRSGMVNKPTYFLAGENGPEMVIDRDAYRNLSPGTKALLTRELRTIKGFEQGMYNNDVTGGSRYEVPAGNSTNDAVMLRVAMALEENTAVMRDLRDKGVPAYYAPTVREQKRMLEDFDKINASRDKAKK
ncbi:phage tail tape measure protein [Flavobacterium sp. RHBU_3]|uniref:phage tail tape measure protein n=1 Tax=Flavobacterium sp. RHBU_3 TaxID=3391184 RepID=UPI003984D4EE